MDYLTWGLLGLIAGVVAKVLHPGRDPGGLIVTVAVGVGGALLGGYLARQLGLGDVAGLDVRSIGIAVVGALVLLIAYRVLFGRKDKD